MRRDEFPPNLILGNLVAGSGDSRKFRRSEGIRRGPGCREPRRKVRLGLPCRRGGNSLASSAYYCDHDRKQQSCQGVWWVAPSIHRASGILHSRKPSFRCTEFSETQFVPLLILGNPICRGNSMCSGLGLCTNAPTTFRCGEFSETRIQPVGCLCVRTGANGSFCNRLQDSSRHLVHA